MRTILRISLIAFLFVISFGTTYWFLDSRLEKPILASDIKKIDIEFIDRKIYLKIYTNRPLTCKSIIKEFEIEPISIKEKTYSPVCYEQKGNILNVVYEEVIEA